MRIEAASSGASCHSDAISLLCHVGPEVNGGQVHVEFSYVAGRLRSDRSKPATLAGLLGEVDRGVGVEIRKLGPTSQL